MSKIKFTYNKVYKYVKGRSVTELVMDGVCIALTGIMITGWTSLVFNLITKGLWVIKL